MTAELKKRTESISPDRMGAILQRAGELPPMPQVVIKAQELVADPNSSVKQVSSLLESDQAIATKVLKMANSAFYGLSGKISSIQHASLVLGYKTLSEIIALAGAASYLQKELPGYGFESQDLWRHSLSVAMGSKIIANTKNPELMPVAYTAGLIHDIGKIILDPYVLENKEDMETILKDDQQTFLNAEKQILGYDHAEIAAEICIKWKIPEIISLAIRYHHCPSASHGDELAYILHMADYIDIMSGGGYGSDDFLYQLESGTMDFLGIQQDAISDITLEVMEYVAKI